MSLTRQKGVDGLRRFIIPIGMVAGGILGVLLGKLFDISADISVCAGAVLGIIVGSIAQSIINEITPDEYFAKMSKKETIKIDAVEAESLDDEEEAATPQPGAINGDTRVIGSDNQPLATGINNGRVSIPVRGAKNYPGMAEDERRIPKPSEPVKKTKKVVIEEEDD